MDDLEQDCFAAQLPAPRRIAGVVVQPFALGHALLLQRLGSPFMDPQATDPGKGDCVLALWVCSRPATEAVARLDWVRSSVWRWFCAWRLRDLATEMIVAGIRSHILHGSTGPKIRVKEAAESDPGTPLLLTLLLHQMKTLHCPEGEAFNAPLKKVKWWYSAHHEAEGHCEITSLESVDEWQASWQRNFPGQVPLTRAMYEEITARKAQANQGGQTHGG